MSKRLIDKIFDNAHYGFAILIVVAVCGFLTTCVYYYR